MAPVWVDISRRLLLAMERNDEAVLFLGRVDYARLQGFIALHPGVADAVGMTRCHQRGHLSYPIVVILTPGVNGES